MESCEILTFDILIMQANIQLEYENYLWDIFILKQNQNIVKYFNEIHTENCANNTFELLLYLEKVFLKLKPLNNSLLKGKKNWNTSGL